MTVPELVFGDLIPYQDIGKSWKADRRRKSRGVSEYSSSCIDMRADEVMVSAWAAPGPRTTLIMASQIELPCTPQLRDAKGSAVVLISRSCALR
jgi:hypothetical protein